MELTAIYYVGMMGHVGTQHTAPARSDLLFPACGSTVRGHVHCSMVEPPAHEEVVHHLLGTNWWSEGTTENLEGTIVRGNERVSGL